MLGIVYTVYVLFRWFYILLIIYISNLTIGKKKYVDVEEQVKTILQKANELKTIANTKIDFEMLINCHIGIMNGKYQKGLSQDFLDKLFSDDESGVKWTRTNF